MRDALQDAVEDWSADFIDELYADFNQFHLALFELASWACDALEVDHLLRWFNYYHMVAIKRDVNDGVTWRLIT